MSKGYLVMAQGPEYKSQVELLAKSIKDTQSLINKISVITDQDVDRSLFDRVIPLPKNNLASGKGWKIHNRVYFLDLSPYDETVILDADMLFLSDVSHWWDYCSKYELLITTKVKTFRDEWVNNSPYRATFRLNKLLDTYSAFAYFKKTDLTQDFFHLLKLIIIDWKNWSHIYSPESRQDMPSIDVAMGIAVKVLGIEEQVTSKLDFPTFTHMKGRCQGWRTVSDKWSDLLGFYKNENDFRIGPYIQTGILHYVEKDLPENKKFKEMFL